MNPNFDEKKLIWRIAFVAAIFILAAGVGFYKVESQYPLVPYDRSPVTVEEVVGVGKITVRDVQFGTEIKWVGRRRLPVWSNGSSSGISGTGNNEFYVSYATVGDVISEAEIGSEISNAPELLSVTLEFRTPKGKIVSPSWINSLWGTQPIESVWSELGVLSEYKQDHPPELTQAPEFTLEIEDAADGWILLNGPIVVDARDGRCIFYTSVFPRDRSELKCRVAFSSRPEKIEFSIPNPASSSSKLLTRWKADERPWERQLTDITLRANGFVPVRFRGKWNAPSFDYEMIPKNGDPAKWFNAHPQKIEDQWGNDLFAAGYQLLGDTSLLRVSGMVTRSHRYQWHQHEASKLVKVRWNGTSHQDVEITKAENSIGLQKAMLLSPSTTGGEWSLEIECGGDPSKERDVTFVVFINGRERSSILADVVRRRPSPWGKQGRFMVGKAPLKIGDLIEFGIRPDLMAEPFVFTLPVDRDGILNGPEIPPD